MMDERSGIVTVGGNPVTLIGQEVKEGDLAPGETERRGANRILLGLCRRVLYREAGLSHPLDLFK